MACVLLEQQMLQQLQMLLIYYRQLEDSVGRRAMLHSFANDCDKNMLLTVSYGKMYVRILCVLHVLYVKRAKKSVYMKKDKMNM
mgnify:CR=1 FL=1